MTRAPDDGATAGASGPRLGGDRAENAAAPFEFVYIGDPMCSWCWGFAPVLERLGATFRIPVRVVVGGLRPGPDAEPLDDRMRRYLAHHWKLVAERSGQPFDHAFLDRDDGWRYDTELPAVAVVAMRSFRPDATLDFFTHLQRAFYTQGIDITDPSRYPGLVSRFDVDTHAFATALGSDESRRAAWHDFAEARSLGVSGFPALLLDEGDRMLAVCRGWAPADTLVEGVTAYLKREHPTLIEGLVCAADGGAC